MVRVKKIEEQRNCSQQPHAGVDLTDLAGADFHDWVDDESGRDADTEIVRK